ncbi:MAG: hypothetical protein MK165_12730 [Pirellulaceae bacterium]|nr:hypothetical protein [Pirellulaceae bacterium]
MRNHDVEWLIWAMVLRQVLGLQHGDDISPASAWQQARPRKLNADQEVCLDTVRCR